MAEEIIYPTGFKRISWGAIFAGVVVAIMVSLLLGLLGIAIGAATISSAAEGGSKEGLGIGAVIWWILTTVISLFAGGCVAGRLAGVPKSTDAMLHGVITWGVVTLIAIALISSTVGGLLAATAKGLGGGLAITARTQPQTEAVTEPSGAEATKAGPELREEVRKAGEKLAQGTAKAAGWGLVALIVGASAAAFGGRVGIPREIRGVRTQAPA